MTWEYDYSDVPGIWTDSGTGNSMRDYYEYDHEAALKLLNERGALGWEHYITEYLERGVIRLRLKRQEV